MRMIACHCRAQLTEQRKEEWPFTARGFAGHADVETSAMFMGGRAATGTWMHVDQTKGWNGGYEWLQVRTLNPKSSTQDVQQPPKNTMHDLACLVAPVASVASDTAV